IARGGSVPISAAQQRLWFFDRMQPGTSHYNIALALHVRGALDERALAAAMDGVVRRHDALRTCIRDDHGLPRAEVRSFSGTAVRRVDLTGLPQAEREREADRLCAEAALTPFDLARGPMAAFLLVRLGADEHRLLFCMHHIASDGWSLGVAARE